MKKLLSALLCLVPVLCFCACDGGASEPVTITTENWSNYFEIRQAELWNYNSFEEVESLGGIESVLCLKEEFWEQGISDKTQLAFAVEGTIREVVFQTDLANRRVSLGEVFEMDTFAKDFSFVAYENQKDSYKWFYDAIADVVPQNCIIAHVDGGIGSTTDANVKCVRLIDEFVVTRVEGQLVLGK